MVFINNTPIFHIIKRTFAEEVCGLYFIFIVAMTLFDASNGHTSFVLINACIAALCFGSFTLCVFANIGTYTEIRADCIRDIRCLLYTSVDELDEKHRIAQANARKAVAAGDFPALIAAASVDIFDEFCDKRLELFTARHKHLAKLSTALLVYMVLMTTATLAVRFLAH